MDGWEIPVRIVGDGLSLRVPTRGDVDRLVEICADPEIARWTRVPSPYGPDDAELWIANSRALQREGRSLQAVVVDEDDRILGSTGLTDIDLEGRNAEIGYLVAADARQQRVGSRAVAAVVDWAFAAGIERIQAHVLVGNDASCRLLASVGFVHEGTLRSVAAGSCGVGLDRVDMHLFSVLPGDRPAPRS